MYQSENSPDKYVLDKYARILVGLYPILKHSKLTLGHVSLNVINIEINYKYD